MEAEIREIEEGIARLQRRGQYSGYATSEADSEADEIGRALMEAVELSDAEVADAFVGLGELEALDEEETQEEVRGALRRSPSDAPS